MRTLSAVLATALSLACSSNTFTEPPTLTHLTLGPSSTTLAPGGTQQFSVTGTWSDGGSRAPQVTYAAGGGTITTGGLYTAGATPGAYQVVAVQQGGTLADTADVTITAPGANQLSITTQPSASAQNGVAFAQQPIVQLEDATSNPLSQAGVSVTAAIASGGGTLGGTTTALTNSAGTATFTNLSISGTAGARTLTFSATGFTSVTSAAIGVTGSGGGGTILFQESFDDANLAGRGWYDLPAGGITSITTAQHIPGSTASLEVDFPLGGTTPVPAVAMRHLFTATDQVYLRYWVKYSANWVGSGLTSHPHEFYFLTNADVAYVGPAYTQLTTYVEQNYQNGGIPRLSAQDGMNIDTTRINVNLYGVTENRAVSGCNGNADGAPTITCYRAGSRWYNGKEWQAASPTFLPNPGTGYKNNWNMVEAYFKLNTIVNGIGQLDGVMQYWFNGQLVIDRHNVILRTGAHPTMAFNQLMFGPYIGNGSPVAQSMWIDSLVVMTAHP